MVLFDEDIVDTVPFLLCLFTSFGSLFKNFYFHKQYDFFIAELQNLVRWERV